MNMSEEQNKFKASNFALEFLKENPEQKYSSSEIAQSLIEKYHEEAESKRATSKQNLSGKLLNVQIQAEITSAAPRLAKMHSQLRILREKPMILYWTNDPTNHADLDFEPKFEWIPFYEEMANEIRKYKSNRQALIEILWETAQENEYFSMPIDTYIDGSTGKWTDVDPFSFMAIFNKNMKQEKRTSIARTIANKLNLKTSVPTSFAGIPLVNNQNAWFFAYENLRKPKDIDSLWSLFENALDKADGTQTTMADFVTSFDEAVKVRGSRWKLTMGLFWVRPNYFYPLDIYTKSFLGFLEIDAPDAKSPMISGDEYLNLRERLVTYFADEDSIVDNFPSLAMAAFEKEEDNFSLAMQDDLPVIELNYEVGYSVKDIVNEGCFLDEELLRAMLSRLATKKNIILQGPPGTGKTWLAKRLGSALIGKTDSDKLLSMQFHSNLSYEDFVRGWRPSGDGSLSLVDGPFLEILNKAKENPDDEFVIVIEELNRGNPAQIFGEMLTLIEADKRKASEAMRLTYQKDPDERVFVPNNLYIVGTMNMADRSLALMDFAFRRRFSFFSLTPSLNEQWREWLKVKGIKPEAISRLKQAILDLNFEISSDPNLGSSYQFGHSFFTPTSEIADYENWLETTIATEIAPALNEYWYEDVGTVNLLLEKFRKTASKNDDFD